MRDFLWDSEFLKETFEFELKTIERHCSSLWILQTEKKSKVIVDISDQRNFDDLNNNKFKCLQINAIT